MSAEPIVHIVDDDPAFRKSLVWLLESVNLRVESYPSARTFLDSYAPSGPSCMVLDVRMPEMSGLDLLDELSARNIRLCIIVVTAYGDVPSTVRAMKSGAVEFIEKPVNHGMLLRRIRQCLEKET